MPDKDIDNLFREKLEGFEAEPSARVWEGISQELQGDKRRRLVPLWSIAASVMLFVVAGLYFILPQKPVTTVSGPKLAASKQQQQPLKPATVTATTTDTTEPKPGVPQVLKSAAITQQIAAHHVRNTPAVKIDKNEGTTQTSQSVATEQPVAIATTAEPLMAAANTVKVPVTTPVVPDVPLTIKPVATDVTTPVMASVQQTKPARKHHGAFTLGDLINSVVSTVDKRADKVIEFTDTDDDQSNITGINLGIIKIKKNNNK